MSASLNSSTVPSALQTARSKIRELLDDMKTVDIRAHEALPAEALLLTLRPRVLTWLNQSLSIIDGVMGPGGESSPPPPDPSSPHEEMSFGRKLDSMFVAQRASETLLGDLAYVAGLELRERARILSSLRLEHGESEVLAQCDGAIRRAKKGLQALENAIARAMGELPQVVYDSELAISLRIRVTYAKLRVSVLAEGASPQAALKARLRAAGTRIAMLIGSDVYSDLKIRDRIQIRSIQRRILEWLRGSTGYSAREGEHLWQDIDSFVRMLELVNKRQELIAHDARLLGELSARLLDGDFEDGMALTLEQLRGLDEELDTMLDNHRAVEPAHWRDVVLRLHAQRTQFPRSEWS